MTRGEAFQLALGYASAAEERAGRYLPGGADPKTAFCEAFADAQAAYNSGLIDYMPSVQTAWSHWYETGSMDAVATYTSLS